MDENHGLDNAILNKELRSLFSVPGNS